MIKHPRAPEGICPSHGIEYEPGENVFLLKNRVKHDEVVVYAKSDGRHQNINRSPVLWDNRVKFHLRPAMCGLTRPVSFVLHVCDMVKVPRDLLCKRCFSLDGQHANFVPANMRFQQPSWIDREGFCDQEPDSLFYRDFGQVRRNLRRLNVVASSNNVSAVNQSHDNGGPLLSLCLLMTVSTQSSRDESLRDGECTVIDC